MRAARPKGKAPPDTPITGKARVCAGAQIHRKECERHEKRDSPSEGNPDSDEPVAKKAPASLALEACPNETTGEEKKQRHQVDVLPGAKKVKAYPSVVVDNRGNEPTIRGIIQLVGRRRRVIEVRKY